MGICSGILFFFHIPINCHLTCVCGRLGGRWGGVGRREGGVIKISECSHEFSLSRTSFVLLFVSAYPPQLVTWDKGIGSEEDRTSFVPLSRPRGPHSVTHTTKASVVKNVSLKFLIQCMLGGNFSIF